MKTIKTILLSLVAAAWLVAGAAQAATPKNTFVMAKDIADIITMDPAEVFELTTGEIIANVYDRVMMFEPEDLQTLVGGVTESYEVSNDGKTITFKLRSGLKFHSGNPVRAEDVAWSLQRVVKLNKTPGLHHHPIRLDRGQCRRPDQGAGQRPCRNYHHRGFLAGTGAERDVGRCCVGGRQGTGHEPRKRR